MTIKELRNILDKIQKQEKCDDNTEVEIWNDLPKAAGINRVSYSLTKNTIKLGHSENTKN